MPTILICSHCAAENDPTAARCGFCNIHFLDLSPRTSPRTPRRDDLTDTHYGIGVMDAEDGAVALTDDLRRALAALNAYYRITGGDRLSDWGIDPARDLHPGWLHMEDQQDGAWHFWHATRDSSVDVAAIRIDL